MEIIDTAAMELQYIYKNMSNREEEPSLSNANELALSCTQSKWAQMGLAMSD